MGWGRIGDENIKFSLHYETVGIPDYEKCRADWECGDGDPEVEQFCLNLTANFHTYF